MPKATFYTHVSHAEAFICRLAQRAVQSGRVLVWAEGAAAAERLDAELWRFEPAGFLAHEMWQGGEWPQDVPLLLGAGADLPAVPTDWVVLNVSPEFWCDAARPPARVLEIVGSSLEELAEARERFKAYKQQGFEIEHHNMQGKA